MVKVKQPEKPNNAAKKIYGMKWLTCFVVLFLLSLPHLVGQEYTVSAVDAQSGKPLHGVPIVLRYACTFTGSAQKRKEHCKFIHRRTGKDGIAHFPEAGSLPEIDGIFPLSVAYREICCDISHPIIPGAGKITFQRRTLHERLSWIFVGD